MTDGCADCGENERVISKQDDEIQSLKAEIADLEDSVKEKAARIEELGARKEECEDAIYGVQDRLKKF